MSRRNKRKQYDTTPKHFRGDPDYKAAFSAAVTEMVSAVRSGAIPDRTERARAIEALTDEYVGATGQRPDAAELERLANVMLHEELTDSRPDKMSSDEYPIMSEFQLARRQAGVHQKKTTRQKGESSLNLASDYATDGVEYRIPKRKRRTVEEQIWRDQKTLSRNKERREKYLIWTKPSKVISYRIGEEAAVSDGVREEMGFIISVPSRN